MEGITLLMLTSLIATQILITIVSVPLTQPVPLAAKKSNLHLVAAVPAQAHHQVRVPARPAPVVAAAAQAAAVLVVAFLAFQAAVTLCLLGAVVLTILCL